MGTSGSADDGRPQQWAQGDQTVQIQGVGAGAHIQVAFNGAAPRGIPLQSAIIPVGRRASAARLLRARSGALPFLVRPQVMEELQAWLTCPDVFSCYLVGGRGGAGKTRLAVELCRLAEDSEWVAGFFTDELPVDVRQQTPANAVDALIALPRPRFVVVDYAESRAAQLESLLPALAGSARTTAPVRLLLLVRASPNAGLNWAESLRGYGDWLDAILDDISQLILDDQPLTLSERADLFSSAVAAFSTRRRHEDSHSYSPLVDATTDLDRFAKMAPAESAALANAPYASPLLVVIAAYLSAHRENEDLTQLPVTQTGLLKELVIHEDRYWRSTSVAVDLDIDSVLRERVVATATLSGAATEDEASELL